MIFLIVVMLTFGGSPNSEGWTPGTASQRAYEFDSLKRCAEVRAKMVKYSASITDGTQVLISNCGTGQDELEYHLFSSQPKQSSLDPRSGS
jgi:hypothetical protein